MLAALRLTAVFTTAALVASSGRAATWGTKFPHQRVSAVAAGARSTFVALDGAGPGQVLTRLSAADGRVLAATKFESWQAQRILASSSDRVFLVGGTDDSIVVLALDADLRTERFRTAIPRVPGERVSSGIATSDGGVLLAMRTPSESEAAKLSASGNVEWRKIFRVPSGGWMGGVSETSRGYLAWGKAACCPYVAALNRNGSVAWARIFRGGGGISGAAELPGGDIVTAGILPSGLTLALWVQKLDASGNEQLEVASEPDTFGALEMTHTAGSLLVVVGVNKETRFLRISTDGTILEQSVLATGNSPNAAASGESLYAWSGDSLGSIASPAAPPSCWARSESQLSLRPIEKKGEPLAFTVSVQPADHHDPARLARTDVPVQQTFCSGSPAATASRAPAPAPSTYHSLVAARHSFESRVQEALLRRDFDTLERIAADARKADEDGSPLYTNLDLFYAYAGNAGFRSRISAASHHDLLTDWTKAKPGSISAQLALVQFYFVRASQLDAAPVAGTADDPLASRQAALDAADRVLRGIGEKNADSYYYVLAVSLAGYRDGDVRALATQSLSAGIHGLTFRIAASLLPTNAEAAADGRAAFAAQAANMTRARYGDGAYAEIAFDAVEELLNVRGTRHELSPVPSGTATVYDEIHFDWDRVRRGYRDLLPRFPQWTPLVHRFARMAVLAGDRATAREILERRDAEWSDDVSDVWTLGDYQKSKAWATMVSTHDDFARSLGSSGAVVRLNATMGEKAEITALNAFLVITPYGVAAVTAIPPSVGEADVDRYRSAMREWSLGIPGRDMVTTRRLPEIYYGAGSPNQRRSTVAIVDSAPAGVTVFSAAGIEEPARGIVLACTSGAGACSPRQIAGRLSTNMGPTFEFIPDQPADFTALAGSPVIQKGVVGIVIRGEEGKAICEPISRAIELAAQVRRSK